MRIGAGLIIVLAGVAACAPSAQGVNAVIAPPSSADPRPESDTASANLLSLGPRDETTCVNVPLEVDERSAGLSTHLQFTIGSSEGLHRIIDLWADSLGPQRLAVTQYRGPNWAFDTSWNVVAAIRRDGSVAGLSITLPPPKVDTTVFPPSVTKGGNITIELTAEEGRQTSELARWLWEGRCQPRESSPSVPAPASYLPSPVFRLSLSLHRRLLLAAALAHPVRHRDLPGGEVLLELAPLPILGADLVAPGADREE
jgi:hypothetical protein